MRSMLLLTIAMASMTVFTACDKKPCPKQQYPDLKAINKIPTTTLIVDNGMLDQNSTKKAFKMIKALRVSEHYYFTLISDYREEFVK